MNKFKLTGLAAIGMSTLMACVPEAPILPTTPQAQIVWAQQSKYRSIMRQNSVEVARTSTVVTKDIQEYFSRCIEGRVQQLVRRSGSVFDESLFTTGRTNDGNIVYIYGKKKRLVGNDLIEFLEPVVRITPNGSGATVMITRQINNGPTEKNIVATANGERSGCATLAL